MVNVILKLKKSFSYNQTSINLIPIYANLKPVMSLIDTSAH